MAWKSVHTRVLVNEYRRSFLFYRDTLGLTATFGNEESGYADFKVGDAGFSLFDGREMAEAIGSPNDPASGEQFVLIFGVDDVDAVTAELKAKGVEPIAEPADHPDWGIRTAHFRDPDGNLIEINEPLG